MKIANEVKELLKGCRGEGESVFIGMQLDRKDYTKINEVLEAAGGNWNRKTKSHIFPGKDGAIVLSELINADKIMTKGDIDAFFTPPEVIQFMTRHINISRGMIALEPSAGIGNIAKFMVGQGVTVDCIENHEPYYKQLFESNLYRSVNLSDFLQVDPNHNCIYDLIMMNPPFSNKSDIDHVIHAMKFLRTGGQLVSVMLPSFNFRSNTKSILFKDVIARNQGIVEKLPPGSFKKEGTEIETVTVTLIKSDTPLDIFNVNGWKNKC